MIMLLLATFSIFRFGTPLRNVEEDACKERCSTSYTSFFESSEFLSFLDFGGDNDDDDEDKKNYKWGLKHSHSLAVSIKTIRSQKDKLHLSDTYLGNFTFSDNSPPLC